MRYNNVSAAAFIAEESFVSFGKNDSNRSSRIKTKNGNGGRCFACPSCGEENAISSQDRKRGRVCEDCNDY